MISKSQLFPKANYNIIRDLIEQVHRRATRLVPETKGLPYNNRLIELQLPTLNFRRQRTDIIQTFKIIKRIDSVNQDCRCPQCPSKLMLKKNQWYNKRAQRKTPNTESNWLQTPLLLGGYNVELPFRRHSPGKNSKRTEVTPLKRLERSPRPV